MLVDPSDFGRSALPVKHEKRLSRLGQKRNRLSLNPVSVLPSEADTARPALRQRRRLPRDPGAFAKAFFKHKKAFFEHKVASD